MEFWAFLCFSLKFSPFFHKIQTFCIHCTVSGTFLHMFSQWQRFCSSLQWWKRILIPCTSCKMSYNVLRQFVGAGGGGGGWGCWCWCCWHSGVGGGGCSAKSVKSLQILDLQRLAGMLLCSMYCCRYKNHQQVALALILISFSPGIFHTIFSFSLYFHTVIPLITTTSVMILARSKNMV